MDFTTLELQSGAYIFVPSNAAYNFGTGDFTLEAWIKTTRAGVIISRKPSEITPGFSNKGWFQLLLDHHGVFKLVIGHGRDYYGFTSRPTVAANGHWHFVAVVRDVSKPVILRLYLDGGLQIGDYTGNSGPLVNVDNDQPLLIGYTESLDTDRRLRHFTGGLSQVRVFNVARSSSIPHQHL